MDQIQRRARRKERRRTTKKLAGRGFRAFMSVWDFKPSLSGTSTSELASFCKAGHKIAKLVADVQTHLDKRAELVKKQQRVIDESMVDTFGHKVNETGEIIYDPKCDVCVKGEANQRIKLH